jgi:D-beta-D-heptose 7-phosphate kinase/D-beta-D-heptose 1-phosphate adenosyltransferase
MTDRAQLLPLVGALAKARVLCVGDVMLDHFHYGTVERISPEAPIPVLKVEREDTMLGGAGNVVRNLQSLGARARFVTVVGGDGDGKEIARRIKKQGVTDKPIVDGGRRTSTKTRYLAGVQQVLRADQETDKPLSPRVEKKLIKAATGAMRGCKVVVLSDYGKGVLSGKAAAEIIKIARKAKKTVIVDPKGSDFNRYRGAGLITPNLRELAEASGKPVETDKDVSAAAKHLIKKHKLGAVLVTRSADGMTVVPAKGRAVHLAAGAQEVFDVSGAGDTVVAAIAAALGAGVSLADAAALANVAAGIVVGKVGTAAAYAADVVASLHHQDLSTAEAKILSAQQIKDRVDAWRRAGHKIGFTNGCFDLLHPGHISLLKQAKRASGRLVVGLNSDSSVSGLKSDGRPVQSEAARATVLASLAAVDAVVIFSEKTPLKLIKALKPDVLVKGADYDLEGVVGADVVKRRGGKVLLAKLEPGYSTSATIARMTK